MEPEAKPRVPFSLEGVQINPWTPVTACYNCCVIPLLEVLLSSSNNITTNYLLFNKRTNKKQFHRTRGCRTQCWKSTNAGNDQGDVHRCTSLFMLPCQSSHVKCVFVARHMVSSRPIKLHNLYRTEV